MTLLRAPSLLRTVRPPPSLFPHSYHAPHFAPSFSRNLASSAKTAASYRRFGERPRSQGPESPRRDEDEDPFSILLSRLPQKQQSQQPAESGYGQAYSYGRQGPRGGFSFHNFKAYLRSPIFLIAVGGGGTYYLLHLEQVEETGRWRFMDVTREMEQQMGAQTLNEVLGEYRGKVLPDWSPEARHVHAVVKRIVQANGLEQSLGGEGEGVKFVTHVVKEDDTKNAFVLPNGHIFVFTGILKVAQDADSLAAVLGHEIAHQVARHSAERMSGMKVFYGLALLLSTFGIDFGISQVLLQLVMNLPNSRKNETEADLIGLRLANAACYDPRAAEGLWQRMGAAEQAPGVDMSFLSTHPSSKNRTVKVREWAEDIIKDRPDQCGPLKDDVGPFQQLTGRRW
ncbi:hypothetical protein JCM11641_002964 [Rhodosporidiobolus odoratus]